MAMHTPLPASASSRGLPLSGSERPGSEALPESLIFVYGTLRTGGVNQRFLAGARYLGEVHSVAEYELVDLAGFPAMVRGGRQRIRGELWAVDRGTLALLDELEDHPDYFRRSPLVLDDGREVEGYLLPALQAAGFPRIASGDWHQPR